MEVQRKYGVEAKIIFPLVTKDAADFLTGATLAAGDATISKDEGAFASTTNTIVEEGNGFYSLTLTATEMQAARICVSIRDQTATKEWEDQAVIMSTYGNASAQHEFDLDTATQSVTVTTNNDKTGYSLTTAPLDAAGIRTAVGLASANLDTQLSTIDTNVDAVLVDTGTTIPAQITGLNNLSAADVNAQVDIALSDYDGPTKTEMDAAFTEIKGATWSGTTDTLEAIRDRGDVAWVTGSAAPSEADIYTYFTSLTRPDAFKADVSSLATSTALSTVDTVVDAIKVKTDSLTFTQAGNVDANIQYVNDVQVSGTGATGDEWGPV